MEDTITAINADGATLLFGGPYSNLQATRAVLAEALHLGVPVDRIICTGDIAAYCGDPSATIALMRESGIAVVRGNCDEQLGAGADNCGCGFAEGSACERISETWYSYANFNVCQEDRGWLRDLPYRIDLFIGDLRLAVLHGSFSAINRFIFATSPTELKRHELDLAGCDGIVAGHCGLPFTEVIDGRLWHNPGVIGMPANDGTSRVWYSLLTPDASGLRIEHRALDYDHQAAALTMERQNLPREYADALKSGLWPNCDVLPAQERHAQGHALSPGSFLWPKTGSRPSSLVVERALFWPDAYSAAIGVTAG